MKLRFISPYIVVLMALFFLYTFFRVLRTCYGFNETLWIAAFISRSSQRLTFTRWARTDSAKKKKKNILLKHDAHESSHIVHLMVNLLCFIYVKCQKDGHLEPAGETLTRYTQCRLLSLRFAYFRERLGQARHGGSSVVCDQPHMILAADVEKFEFEPQTVPPCVSQLSVNTLG